MDPKAPWIIPLCIRFSRWARNADERVTLKSLWKKSKKRRKTLLHGFHFHYETHNRRNLTVLGEKKTRSVWQWWCEWKGEERGKRVIMKTSLISADPPTLVRRAIVGAITNSAAAMSLKMPDCVNFPTRCHAEIIGWAARREAAFCEAGCRTKKSKTTDGCVVTQRPPAKLAGGWRSPINSAEQNGKILDSRKKATTASPCCCWPTALLIFIDIHKKKTC